MPDIVKKLMRVLADNKKIYFYREKAAKDLGDLSDQRAVLPLCKVLSNVEDHEDVRAEAAVALGEIGDERAVEPLCMALADIKSRVRESAARALDKMASTRTLSLNDGSKDLLIDALKNAYNHANYSAVAGNLVDVLLRSLGVYDSEIAGLLVSAFRNEHERRGYVDRAIGRARAEIVQKIGHRSDARLADLIAAKLDDDFTLVRFEAACALLDVGDLRCVRPLISILNCQEVKFGSSPIEHEKDVIEGAHDALLKVLKLHAADVSTDVLEALRKQSPISYMELAPIRREVVHDDSDSFRGYIQKSLNRSLLAQLSGDELARRGIARS